MVHSRTLLYSFGALLLLLLGACSVTSASVSSSSSSATSPTDHARGWNAPLWAEEDDLRAAAVRRHARHHDVHHDTRHHARSHMTPAMGIRVMANRVVRALERGQPRLLLPLFDRQTMLVYHSELPCGGTFKGGRGLQQFAERLDKTIQVHSNVCNLTAIDEARGTALMECARSLTMRSTGKHVNARAVVALKSTCGRTLEVINVVELDYNKMMNAFRSRPEQLLHKLSRVCAQHGSMSAHAQTLWENNITLSWSTLSNKNIFLTNSKAAFNKLMNDSESGLKFVNWVEKRVSAYQPLMSLDDNRVVTIEFSGDLDKQIRNFRSVQEGLYQMGAGTMDFLMVYTLWEFSDRGLLQSAHAMVNRPMTALDLCRLREQGIKLNETDI